ncbi:MAG: hypothetical protein ABSA04_11880 [Desulfobaccales bacterium]|jgi:hypothetical protein
MSKIRAFDLAKEFGVESRELAIFIKERTGVSVHHLSVLDPFMVQMLRKIWPHGISEKNLAEVDRTLPFEQPRIYQDKNGWWRIEGNNNRFSTEAEAQKALAVIDRYQEKTASPKLKQMIRERRWLREKLSEVREAQGREEPNGTSQAAPNSPPKKGPQDHCCPVEIT